MTQIKKSLLKKKIIKKKSFVFLLFNAQKDEFQRIQKKAQEEKLKMKKNEVKRKKLDQLMFL